MATKNLNLGIVPVSRGEFNSTTMYYKDNIVQYKRGSYQVVSESPIIGISPTNDKNVVNPEWTLFAGTLDAQDVVNQIKEQEAQSIQAIADREAEILAKSDAAKVSFDNTGTSLSGTNVQDALKETNGKLFELESEVIYDVTANNDGATFPSLSALLSSDNLSALIPTSVRHGGMSIRFIQSSDNKYVEYRLMADDWSTDTNNWSFCRNDVYVENPEYIEAKTDSEGKLLEGIQADGAKVIGGNLNIGGSTSISGSIKVLGKMEVSRVSYKVIENPEYLAAWVDAEDKVIFGLKADGKTYVGDATFLNDVKKNQEAINEIKSYLVNFDNLDIDALLSITEVENHEFIEVTTDSEGKILAGRTPDGAAFENIGFTTPKVSIDGYKVENIEDQEERIEISIDAKGKIISYRDVNGKIHEEVGIETNQLTLTKEGMEDFKQQFKDSSFLPNKSVSTKEYDLPEFGYVNLVSETFYLTAAGWSSYANDVELIQDYEDSNANAWNKITIAHFYIKGTSTILDFYAASKVTKVNNTYYVTSSLTKIEDPSTHEISYNVNDNSIEVRQCVDVPPYKAWSVDKKTEHYCVVEIDFGHYLNGTFYVGIKYQGSSTLQWRKRNFRFTFYNNNKYEKKYKIKIGEFVRLNGFNLKANWTDNTKIKELFMNILFMAIWENRGKCTSYPWDGDGAPYNSATGMIKGFPIEINVGGTFYGLDVFSLKKDGKNYLLDKDEDGMIEGGTRNDVGCWKTAAPIDWEDELNDEKGWVIDNQTQSNYDALTNFFAFINGTLKEGGTTVPFNKSTMPERMYMPAWIDYLICLQVFLMLDNTCRNVMLYTSSDKKKFYPFFYDLDTSMKYDNPTMDIMIPNGSPDWQEGGCYAYDLSLWEHIKEEWWDEIVNRYHELRHDILSDEYIKAVYEKILNNIPDEEYSKESQRWGLHVSKQNFYDTINQLKVRFNWLDNEYYK